MTPSMQSLRNVGIRLACHALPLRAQLSKDIQHGRFRRVNKVRFATSAASFNNLSVSVTKHPSLFVHKEVLDEHPDSFHR
ncbi:Uncharacterised protein [Bordetella pseudohinzii]|uniref:Uncharacterized protein n=1 Tax=Bordetella pseudohinzii TaxID=1331258 RepID=A0A0M7EJH8_9BORD|nr:Uncharacterised protein [Bordetella pseudohinzii]